MGNDGKSESKHEPRVLDGQVDESAIGCIWEYRSRNRRKVSDNFSFEHGDFLVSGGHVEICVDRYSGSFQKDLGCSKSWEIWAREKVASCQNVGG